MLKTSTLQTNILISYVPIIGRRVAFLGEFVAGYIDLVLGAGRMKLSVLGTSGDHLGPSFEEVIDF